MIINDPFQTGRSATRLLFDFSVATSFLRFDNPNKNVLDFACGTGWASEFLNKLGFDVFGFDINKDAIKIAKDRYKFDQRINSKALHFSFGDGHKLPYKDNFFGHLLCFDSLHHMRDFKSVFEEIYRVLEMDGIAIFVEPGSRHADSKETKQFLKDDPHGDYWIERSVDMLEIYNLSKAVGFKSMTVKPYNDPSIVVYSFIDWYNILDNSSGIENQIAELRRFNYEDRVIFALAKA